MSMRRFEALLTSIHLNDNAVASNRGSPGFDKLNKQYMLMKPIKRGYKVWTRSDETGYVCQFRIYARKADNQSSEQGLGEGVVGDLTEICPDDRMLVLKWKDNRSITMISNAHTPSEIKTVKRKRKDGETFPVHKSSSTTTNTWTTSIRQIC
ncbi:hypothetical protein HPB47_002492 [Ixodes persulcatus]|uniref:Uncharacterized protein n=1 Tax=Ixodes persulcatus TaxID=34615 RepID=A0AC60PL27_IXOPE|nr:hypothetical protein HPB47_002492 [Ixodes persulcatus]